MPDIPSKSQSYKMAGFRAVCEAHAARFGAGKLALIDAVDFCQNWAMGRGLVAEFGQDAVQQIMHEAFRPHRRDL